MIKNIVLDWHGVLDLVSPMTLRKRFIGIFLQLLIKAKFAEAWHVLRFSFDIYNTIINDYAAGKITPESFWTQVGDALGQALASQFRDAMMEVQVNRQLFEYLQNHSDRYNFFILSDCPIDKKTVIQKHLTNILNFQSIYFSCDYQATKREYKLFQIFLANEKLDPTQTLFIDDSHRNIKIAKTFNIRAYLYKTNQSPSQLEHLLQAS